jgi:hypothetical protein
LLDDFVCGGDVLESKSNDERLATRGAHELRGALCAGARPGRWRMIARESGYFDQAHLIADFRDFAQAPPTGLGRDTERSRRSCGEVER